MRTEAFGIGGLGIPYKGISAIEPLVDAISPEIDLHTRRHQEWEKIADGIIARSIKWGKPDLIVLVALSWGCKRIPEIARRLNSHGMVVHYAAGIDPTRLPPPNPFSGKPPQTMSIPANILHVDEFHATSGVVERGRRKGAPGGKFVFDEDWNGTKSPITIVPGGHIACAKNPITQTKIKHKIQALLEELG